jgi:carboxyl-terminal processing protease
MKPQTIGFRFILPVTLFFLFAACKKNSSLPPAGDRLSFAQIFDAFWRGMSRNYVYWNLDTTNWSAMYNIYKPRFDRLDINNNSDIQQSVSLFRQMTQGLIDGHYYISFTNPNLSGAFIYPSYEQKRNRSTFHNPFPYRSITVKYLDAGYYEGFDSITVSNAETLYALCGTIQHRYLYFYCNRFTLLRSWSSSRLNSIKPLLSYFFSLLHNMPPNIEKVILDLRGNRGGDISDLNYFGGQFIGNSLQIGYTRYKSNSNQLDYTPWVPAIITPQPGAKTIANKIIVLIDNFTASLAELVTLAIHTLPNGIVIGEHTWGATGPLTANHLYNDGSFDVAGFMHIETASAQFKSIADKMYEGTGILPDITVPYNFTELNAGVDAVLEKAMTE